LVKIFTGLFTGDWALMWEGLKQLVWGAIEVIWGWLNLSFFGKIIKGIGSFVKIIYTTFRGGWESIRLYVMYFVDDVVAWFVRMRTNVTNAFTSLRNSGASIFQSLRGAISSAWNSIWSTVTSLASKIYSSVSSKFASLKNAMLTPINSARGLISTALGKIKSMFSGLLLKIPKPKVPFFSVHVSHKKIGGINVPYPNIDVGWKAKGGLFDGPSIIGIGEKTKEAAIPLEGRYMRPFAEEIASQMPANAERAAMTIEIPLYLNGREVARAVATDMNTALDTVRRITKRGRGR